MNLSQQWRIVIYLFTMYILYLFTVMQRVWHGRPIVSDSSAHGDGNFFATGIFLYGKNWTAAATTIPAVTITTTVDAQDGWSTGTGSRC